VNPGAQYILSPNQQLLVVYEPNSRLPIFKPLEPLELFSINKLAGLPPIAPKFATRVDALKTNSLPIFNLLSAASHAKEFAPLPASVVMVEVVLKYGICPTTPDNAAAPVLLMVMVPPDCETPIFVPAAIVAVPPPVPPIAFKLIMPEVVPDTDNVCASFVAD
jgi:hypothetical protein